MDPSHPLRITSESLPRDVQGGSRNIHHRQVAVTARKQPVDQTSGSTTHIDHGGIRRSTSGIDHPQRLRRVCCEPAPRRLPLEVGIIPMRTQFRPGHNSILHQ
jgi:hypothetical protein